MSSSTYQQLSAYTSTQKEGESLREIEARALLNCANKIRQAQEQEGNCELYIDAIKNNQRLWTVFQVSLCEPNNELPRDLKVTLLNLSRFVDKVSLRALAEYNPGLLSSLIEINRNIAAGLSVKNVETPLQPPSESMSVSASA
ncbi:MAG: flagellar biosynthesis regulator FlaF [Alphaproteobacteria bacterium]